MQVGISSEIANWRQSRSQVWPIFHRQDALLVGCCGLRPRAGDPKVAELGFQLCHLGGKASLQKRPGPSSHGLACRALPGFAGLVAGHHPENEPSKRVLLRLGFSDTHHEQYPPTVQLYQPELILTHEDGFWRFSARSVRSGVGYR